MIKEKRKEHGLEYVILNDDESELWEIDYDSGHAANVGDYMKIDSLRQDSIIKYSGTIKQAGREGNIVVKYRIISVLYYYSLPSQSVFQTIMSMITTQVFSMSKQQQYLQTEREPDIETEIDCPRCYDIMTLSYDFDKLYYFCEECNLSLLIK